MILYNYMDVTRYISDCIQNKIPIAFLKYGDGEYSAAKGHKGHNCDNDKYTDKLRNGLIDSFKFMVDERINTMIGQWHNEEPEFFWNSLVKKKPNYVNYHTFILDHEYLEEKAAIFKSIKQSPLKKIYICNPLMVRAKILLNIDHMIHVPFNNWFDDSFDNILASILDVITPGEQFILLTSAGMGAKVLIAEVSKRYPNSIYLDIGSALDKICTKKSSRGWEPQYHYLMFDLRDIIPPNWESSEYQSVFEEAREKIGKHGNWTNDE